MFYKLKIFLDQIVLYQNQLVLVVHQINYILFHNQDLFYLVNYYLIFEVVYKNQVQMI